MSYDLRNLRITRVAYVNRGANPYAEQVIFKHEEGASMTQKDDKGATETLEAVQKERDELQAKVAKLEAAQKPPPDPVEKADPVVRERLEKAEAEAKAARDEVRKLRDDKERTEWVAKAAEFGTFGKADDFGLTLRKVANALEPDELKKFLETLRAHEQIAQTSALLKEKGMGGEDTPDDPEQKLMKMARERAAKDGVSVGEALIQVSKSDEGKKIYANYRAQQRGGA